MIDERELAIHPIVQESVQHNTQVPIPFFPDPPLAIPKSPFHSTLTYISLPLSFSR